jgi:K+-transporting ATPase A subunit
MVGKVIDYLEIALAGLLVLLSPLIVLVLTAVVVAW